jgi:hypothetical protein
LAAVTGYVGTITDVFIPSIDGCWDVIDTVETSDWRGLRIQFRLTFAQNGRRFSANGEKTHVNGVYLPASEHVRIQVKEGAGFLSLTEASATFSEYGIARETVGSFRWRITRELLFLGRTTSMQGEFSSTAGNTTGRSEARRCAT